MSEKTKRPDEVPAQVREPREWWVNRYRRARQVEVDNGMLRDSREAADKHGTPDRLECVHVREVLPEPPADPDVEAFRRLKAACEPDRMKVDWFDVCMTKGTQHVEIMWTGQQHTHSFHAPTLAECVDKAVLLLTPEKPEPFKMTGPGFYKQRNGATAEVVGKSCQEGKQFPWVGLAADGEESTWSDNGTFCNDNETPVDLVERLP